MRYTNNFVIHTTEQLIDINKGLKNFEANMTITSENEDDQFDIVIVTQKQLDDTNFTLNYKQINHYISINVKSNKQEENDYVLVIRSSNKVKVEIAIDIVNLDENVEDVQEVNEEASFENDEIMSEVGIDNDDIISDIDMNEMENNIELSNKVDEVENIIENYTDDNKDNKDNKVSKGKYKRYLKYLFILLLVGGCVYFLFFTNSSKKKDDGKKKLKIESDEILDSVESVEPLSITDKSSPKTEPSKKSKKSRSIKVSKEGGNESLLEQLRRIREN